MTERRGTGRDGHVQTPFDKKSGAAGVVTLGRATVVSGGMDVGAR